MNGFREREAKGVPLPAAKITGMAWERAEGFCSEGALKRMLQRKMAEEAVAYIRTLFQGNSDGHDFDHSMRVYRNAMQIAEKEPGCDKTVVALGALLHDADDSKLFTTEDNAHARAFLREQGADEEETERICRVINAVSFSKNRGRIPDTTEGRIVQDADRLDAIGAIGIARTFAYSGKHGRALDSSIDHFYEKLLRLKDMMNTEEAKAMAERRHAFLESFLREWNLETGTKDPDGNP